MTKTIPGIDEERLFRTFTSSNTADCAELQTRDYYKFDTIFNIYSCAALLKCLSAAHAQPANCFLTVPTNARSRGETWSQQQLFLLAQLLLQALLRWV
jgi:hypothetical protein